MIERIEIATQKTPSDVDRALNKVINATHVPDIVVETTVARDLSGRIFETIAHEAIQAKQPEHRTLLTPEQTFRFFRRLHPYAETMSDSFGPKGIKGVTVPDGLLYDTRWEDDQNNGLVRLYEYTLTKPVNFLDYVHKKEHAFQVMRNKHDTLLSNAELVFVIPAVYGLELPYKFRGRSRIETVDISPQIIREVSTNYVQSSARL